MATKSIKKILAKQPDKRTAAELRSLYEAALTDITALKTAVTALIASHNTLATKLNADAGVTDTNYAQSTATSPTLTLAA